MRRLLSFFFFALILFTGSFVAARFYPLYLHQKGRSSPFLSAPYSLKNRPFTVVMIGRNNGATLEKTLRSVFSQNYDSYRLIYIDDASDDGSFDLARDLVYASDRLTQTTLVQNEKQLGILANLVRAIETCQNEEIVVVLENEDWLSHEWVLQRLNAYYEDPSLWLAYGQSIDFPSYKIAPARDFTNAKFRAEPTTTPYLKTFYAALFKKIRPSDLIQGGDFLSASADFAYMTPMLEMGQDHFHFISEVLSVHDQNSLPSEDRELRLRSEQFVRSLDPYPPLTVLLEVSWDESSSSS